MDRRPTHVGGRRSGQALGAAGEIETLAGHTRHGCREIDTAEADHIGSTDAGVERGASLGAPSGLEPGVGLVNLALYRGLTASAALVAGLWLCRLAAAAVLLWEARRGRFSMPALSAVGLTVMVFLSTDATEASLALPLLLLVLASLEATGWLAAEPAEPRG